MYLGGDYFSLMSSARTFCSLIEEGKHSEAYAFFKKRYKEFDGDLRLSLFTMLEAGIRNLGASVFAKDTTGVMQSWITGDLELLADVAEEFTGRTKNVERITTLARIVGNLPASAVEFSRFSIAYADGLRHWGKYVYNHKMYKQYEERALKEAHSRQKGNWKQEKRISFVEGNVRLRVIGNENEDSPDRMVLTLPSINMSFSFNTIDYGNPAEVKRVCEALVWGAKQAEQEGASRIAEILKFTANHVRVRGAITAPAMWEEEDRMSPYASDEENPTNDTGISIWLFITNMMLNSNENVNGNENSDRTNENSDRTIDKTGEVNPCSTGDTEGLSGLHTDVEDPAL